MKKYLHNFASKSMKIEQNFYVFHAIPVFLHLDFLAIFSPRKNLKNNNFKAKASKIQKNNICYQISNKFVDFLGFKNA